MRMHVLVLLVMSLGRGGSLCVSPTRTSTRSAVLHAIKDDDLVESITAAGFVE